MKETTAEAFANREEPIPLLTVTTSDDDEASVNEEGKGAKADKIREKLHDVGRLPKADSGGSLQDRLFAKYAAS